MGVYTGFSKTGYNTTGNLRTADRTAASVALGKVRNTVGSSTRKFKYCNQANHDLNAAFACTFSHSNTTFYGFKMR